MSCVSGKTITYPGRRRLLLPPAAACLLCRQVERARSHCFCSLVVRAVLRATTSTAADVERRRRPAGVAAPFPSCAEEETSTGFDMCLVLSSRQRERYESKEGGGRTVTQPQIGARACEAVRCRCMISLPCANQHTIASHLVPRFVVCLVRRGTQLWQLHTSQPPNQSPMTCASII